MFTTIDDVNEVGSYVADEVAGWPVLVVRAPDGSLKGYLNVCPHRAGVIAWPGQGTASNLVCRYHGWAFDWSGCLKSARDFGSSVCADENSLTPIEVATWGPLVFVRLDVMDAPLDRCLHDLDSRVNEFGFSAQRHRRRMIRELSCNWKTYVDNYLEAYHVPLLHPLLRSALDLNTYEVSVPHDSYCLHESATTAGSASSGVWVFRYPNLAINVYPDAMNVERIVPVSVDRTRIVYDYFTAEDANAAIDSMIHMSNVTLDEDQTIAEAVQRNLNSGAYRAGQLSPKHEIGLAWFQDRIRRDVGE